MRQQDARARLSEQFEEKRRRAEAQADARREDLRLKNAEFAAILAEKESYYEKIVGAMQGTPQEAQQTLARLREEHRALREREEKQLRALGLDADYLKPRRECPLCDDRGFLEDGRMCACFRKELNRLLARESGLFSLFDKQTFDNFDPALCSASLRQTAAELKRYAETFDPAKSSNLLFVGGTGVGKTHLSSAIGRVVLERGYSVVYESALTALSALETERFSESKPQSERLTTAELLILDDLGIELPGKASVSYFYYLINTRLIAHLPTVISTNLSARELENRYEPRIFSRLTGEYGVYVFDGADRRGREE